MKRHSARLDQACQSAADVGRPSAVAVESRQSLGDAALLSRSSSGARDVGEAAAACHADKPDSASQCTAPARQPTDLGSHDSPVVPEILDPNSPAVNNKPVGLPRDGAAVKKPAKSGDRPVLEVRADSCAPSTSLRSPGSLKQDCNVPRRQSLFKVT